METPTVHHGAMFDTNELVINMGPQHPSTHGVLRVVLRLDGEKVVDADVVIGYLHRGIEKLSENRNWTQIILLTDRMDYVAAATNNVGYCETVEKLMSLEVPRRARYVRTILCELQRIASHCLWLGTHAMDIGAMTVFLYAFRERELILDLFEEFCGARLTYNSMRIGGLPLDIPPGWDKKVLEFCTIMDAKVDEYEELLTHNRIWLERTKGIGVISGAEAIALGLSGPPLRGSGVPRDVRKDEPYAAYDEMEFDVPIGTAGDTYDRYLVRHRGVPAVAADHPAGDRRACPKGRSSARCRASSSRRRARPITRSSRRRASSATSSSATASRPTRTGSACGRRRSATCRRCRTLVEGHLVADVVALIGSLDVVLGEVDRMIDGFVIPLLKILIVLNATLVAVTYMVLLERKVIAWAQSRLGPMRVGPYGILQPVADAVKLMIKEDITPVRADKWVFTAAPIISMVPALIVYAVIPFGPEVSLFGRQVTLYITDINVGLLYIVSVASVGVYGIILAGYASNSKYPLLASLRASAQLISYEVAVTLTLVSVILMAGTLSMVGIVDAQDSAHVWFAFVQPVAFVHFLHRRPGRDQPRAVRPAGGGAGADRRLPHRVQRHALRAVLPRRIREHDRRVVGGDDAVPRRLAAAVPERRGAAFPRLHSELDLVSDQVVRVPLHLHLGPRDAAALSLRPADAARVEGADPAGDRQPGRDGDREGDVAQ